MIPINIQWNREISKKPKFRSTWGAEINGSGCIVKKIEVGDREKLSALAKSLKKQVHFNGRLKLREPGKVCLFDDMLEGNGFIALYRPYIPGSSLESMISNRCILPSEAVKICMDTARVLQIAHAKNIYHGDLNPRNIIVGDGGAISIVDWDNTIICDGIQEELIGPDATREDVGAAPEYMPLEQFRGSRVQPQTDVYALGVILYQMLCGHTPFDGAGAKTPLELGRYKEKNEPESIRKAHPGLRIPDELDALIEQALKNDPRQRIASIDLFIQKLQGIKFDSESLIPKAPVSTLSPDTTVTVPVPGPSSLPISMNEQEYKLLIIGHSGSGKTSLIAGLHAINNVDFTVTEPGGRTRAGLYLSAIKNDFGKRKWPPPTSMDDIVHISCIINYKGRRKRIAFDDYAGERLGTDSFYSLFSKPDGAFILLNPSGPQWSDPEQKNRMIGDLKTCIDLLCSQPNKPPIALIITASDCMNDLDTLTDFENCLKELENDLTSRKYTYRTFRVSVSGKLNDPYRPQLKPRGLKDPFIWMLEHFDAFYWRRRIKRIFAAAAAVAALLLVVFGWEYCREAYNVSSLKNEYRDIETSFSEKGSKTKQDYLTRVINLVNLRNRFCSKNHFSNTTRLGECSASCRPSFFLSSFGISSFRNDFDKTIALLEDSIDSANLAYLSIDLDDALRNPTEENRKVMGRIEKWNTLRAENDRERIELQRKCADELPRAVESYDQNLLEKEFLAIIDNPGTTFPSSLDSTFRNWIAMESKRPKRDWDEAVESMKGLELRARRAVENRRFETLLAALEGIGDSMPQDMQSRIDEWNKYPTSFDASERQRKDDRILTAYQNAANRIFEKAYGKQRAALDSFSGGTVDELAGLAKDYLAFRKESFPGTEPGLLKTGQDELDQKVSLVVANFARSKQDEARKKFMESGTYRTPEYPEEVKKKVTSQFSKEYNGLEREMNAFIDELVSEGKKEWDEVEKRKIDDFLAEIGEVTTPVALDRFKAFSLEYGGNPFFEQAENAFVKFIEDHVDEMIRNFGETEDDYRSMYDVAAKIRSSTSRKLKETWMNRFANEFFEMMNVEHTLTITDIQVSAKYDDGAYIENCIYTVGNRPPVVLIDDLTHSQEDEAVFKEKMTTLPFFEAFSVPCSPWENIRISFDLWKNVRRGLDKAQGTKTMTFIPGSKKKEFVNFESSDIVFRIFFQLNYKKMPDILSEIGKYDTSE